MLRIQKKNVRQIKVLLFIVLSSRIPVDSISNTEEEDKLRQRAERYAEIKRRNKRFWFVTSLIISGLIGSSIGYRCFHYLSSSPLIASPNQYDSRFYNPKKVRLPIVQLDERAKYGLASAVACLSIIH